MNHEQSREPLSARSNQLEPLLTEQQYAAITGRSLASIRRDRQLGVGCPFTKLGALVRYRPADVREYLEACTRGKVSK